MTTLLIKAVQARLPEQTEFSTQEQIANVIEAITAVVLENGKTGETTRFGSLGTFKTTQRPGGTMPAGTGKDGKSGGKAYPAYVGLHFDDSQATREELTAAKAVPAPEAQVETPVTEEVGV